MQTPMFEMFMAMLDHASLSSFVSFLVILKSNFNTSFDSKVDEAAHSVREFLDYYESNLAPLGVIGREWPFAWPDQKTWVEVAKENGIPLPPNTLIWISGLLEIAQETATMKAPFSEEGTHD
jgi:hypothetical protein